MTEEKMKQNMETKEMSFEERQYQRLIDARNFHYENFNKWSLYFYAIIAALFVGYYNVKDSVVLSMVIAAVGYVVSICCHLSGKGYYYWENNWIKLIMHYEKQVWPLKKEESVYSIFADEKGLSNYWCIHKGANISSSKLSLIVSFTITSAWAILISMQLASDMCYCCIALAIMGAIFGTWVLSALVGWVLHSDLTNHDDLRLPAKEERKNI
ncbi:MAG: hypothetical protein IJV61_06455 [Paludibacteraceae bacterium]|nr:hypothetical protein [Paludibacteraceae bacterium]